MNTDLLHIFIDVAQSKSFADVAKKKNIDPSNISRAISTLENKLGTRLFNRTTRSITLTEAGVVYLDRVKPICEELDRAQNDIISLQNEVKGNIRFTASVSFGQSCLLPLLPKLRKEYPNLSVDLTLSDQNEDIIKEQLDFAIRLNKTADKNFIRTKLKSSYYRVCASPDYIQHSKAINTPRDLSNHQCLLFDLPQYRERWQFIDSQGQAENIPVNGHIVLSNAIAIKDCALRDLGIALLPDWLTDDDIATGRLMNIFPQHKVSADNFDTGIWIVYPNKAFLPTKTRATIDFIRKNLNI